MATFSVDTHYRSEQASVEREIPTTMPSRSVESLLRWLRQQSERLEDYESGPLEIPFNFWLHLTRADHRPDFVGEVAKTGDFGLDIGPYWSGLTGALRPIDIDEFDSTPRYIFSSMELPQEILNRLQYLAALQSDWDGEGASQVNRAIIDKVKNLLLNAYIAGDGTLPSPFIGPTHDGMIVVEWTTDSGNELILDVPPDGASPGFLLVEPQASGEEQEIEAEIGDEWPIERVIRKFMGN